jgi:hypothetical protein
MIKNRTKSQLSPQQFFDQILQSTLFWPGKTISLERNTLMDYRHRPMMAGIAVSEMYHENSKLFPQMLPELSATRVQADAVREEFLQRRAVVMNATVTKGFELDGHYRDLMTRVTRMTPPELFYAVDLRFVSGNIVAEFEPISSRFLVVKQLCADNLDLLRRAVSLTLSPDAPDADLQLPTGPLLFILGSFARNDVIFGARGYRRTLLEAGRVAQEIHSHAREVGVKTRAVYEFIDREVDLAMEADGVEQGTLVVFEFTDA